jgi:integrase
VTSYGLRHTAGKTLADVGADPRAIQAFLGQRSLAIAIHHSRKADRRRTAAAKSAFCNSTRTTKWKT